MNRKTKNIKIKFINGKMSLRFQSTFFLNLSSFFFSWVKAVSIELLSVAPVKTTFPELNNKAAFTYLIPR